jgi:hypothetical protein
MFKIIKKIIKWIFRIAILVVIVFIIIFIYNFLVNGIVGQASDKCKALVEQNGGANSVAYGELADWLKTQSTSIVTVKNAYYENNPSQIVVKYSIFRNIYTGTKIINADTLDRYCKQ